MTRFRAKWRLSATGFWIFFGKQWFYSGIIGQPNERTDSQKDIAEKLTKWTNNIRCKRTSVIEQPTIAVNRHDGGLPISIHYT
jgi:hypothetical protein